MVTTGVLVMLAGAFGAGLGIGLIAGILLSFFGSIRPLLGELRRMRFAGWRTVEHVEQPKTAVPMPFVRED